MNKNLKKGFTLIELLAVIVILAIVAVIAIPTLLGVIDKANLGKLKDSAYGLANSAELYLAQNQNEETLEFVCNANKCVNGDKTIQYKGNIESGRVKIYKNGSISVCIQEGTNSALKRATGKDVIVNEGSCNYDNDDYQVDELISITEYNKIKEEKNKMLAALKTQEIISDETASNDTIVEQINSMHKTQLINLGSGATIDVSSYEGYENFTADNFIIQCNNGSVGINASQWYATSTNASSSFATTKSYNASTGVLTVSAGISIGASWVQQGEPYSGSKSNSAKIAYTVYLVY